MIITEFVTDLFENQEGFIYSPFKKILTTRWYSKFFQWPDQKDKFLEHIQDFNDREIYLSPALFTAPRINPTTFKGTSYVWAEFDGEVPTNPDFAPTIRIQSSESGHEHWYWRLDHFETDKNVIEEISKRLAYHYGADLSGWDYQQVLRPPDTFNHKRGKPVVLLNHSISTYSTDNFNSLPEPPATAHTTIDTLNLPKLTLLELMHKEVKYGARSDALARLAFECVEMGMSNEEVYVVIEEADQRWQKFVGRDDRQRRLAGIISHVRAIKAQQYEIIHKDQQVFRFKDFLETEIKLEWIIENVLPVSGSAVIFGKGGIGKSTFSLRLAISLALGRDQFLGWSIAKRVKVLFTSLEMQHDELKQFFLEMGLTTEEIEELQEWFYIWPIGHAYPFDTPDQQIEILKQIDQHNIGLIIIDSHALAMYGSIKDDDAVKRLNSFLNEDVRKARGCGYFFIHHPRKLTLNDPKKPVDQDDSFGSIYIMYNAQTIMHLHPMAIGSNRLELKFIKSRMTEGNQSLMLERKSNRDFEVVDPDAKPQIKMTPVAPKIGFRATSD